MPTTNDPTPDLPNPPTPDQLEARLALVAPAFRVYEEAETDLIGAVYVAFRAGATVADFAERLEFSAHEAEARFRWVRDAYTRASLWRRDAPGC